jgi:hypothetical protein
MPRSTAHIKDAAVRVGCAQANQAELGATAIEEEA